MPKNKGGGGGGKGAKGGGDDDSSKKQAKGGNSVKVIRLTLFNWFCTVHDHLHVSGCELNILINIT